MLRLVSATALSLMLAAGPVLAQSADTLVPQMSELEVTTSTQDLSDATTFVPEILAILMILLVLSGSGSGSDYVCRAASLVAC